MDKVKIPELSGIERGLGTTRYLPCLEECNAPDGLEAVASDIFHNGARGCPPALMPKEGVNWREALSFVYAHLMSFDPSHEHKIAGCAQLLSNYFDLKE